jgi:hypothetical protein
MGVFVLGMHRSGTSAVTRVVNLLGVPIGRPERLMPVQADNPAGFWEHLALMDVNDAVLARLGGSWDAPPPADAHERTDLDDLARRARAEFDETYDGDRWVFKDPRVSLLLPFWRGVLESDRRTDVAIVVLRNPLDIAASLARRNRFATAYALALWEHYTHAIVRDATSLPALVVDYDTLVDDAPRVVDALDAFLTAHGQLDGGADRTEIRDFLAAGLRHTRHDRAALDADARVTAEQRALYDVLAALVGAHDDLAGAAVPAPSPSTAVLLAARRDARTPELQVVDALCRQLGDAEGRLDECTAEAAALRPTVAAVEGALGSAELGRVERAALGAARRVRAVQARTAPWRGRRR